MQVLQCARASAGYWFIASTISGCIGHSTTAVARSDHTVTFVQRPFEYLASDTIIDCRVQPSGDRQCDVLRLDGAR